jgi:manganese-dependent inorganic pyrophosphatase
MARVAFNLVNASPGPGPVASRLGLHAQEFGRLSLIYVTGHQNPDADSIASAIGYAELKRRLDPRNGYVAVRLGEPNAQTSWLIEKSGAPLPDFLPHVFLRVCDVMRESFPTARHDEPVREVGLTMAREGLDLVPIVNDEKLVGVMTERALARRYIRESRGASQLDAPTAVGAIVGVLQGTLVTGDSEREIAGRVWVLAMDVSSPTSMEAGDVVVVGDRPDVQRRALERGAALLVTSNGTKPVDEVLELAREQGACVVTSSLDSYVTARMVTLAAPCHALMDGNPLTVRIEDLVSDISGEVKDVHYRAAVAVDAAGRPVGLVTRSDLVSPQPRRVLLVDHAEQGQSVPGVQDAEIVEILDHHHIGSIETRVPVAATFDPVGSTATLVVERYRQAGMEPTASTAMMLLGAVLSDTVILNSPTTTERDHAVIEYLERVLAVDATQLGREMFERTSDVSQVPASEILARDAKEYEVGAGQTISIAQIETVGDALLERKRELLEALHSLRERQGHVLSALMVTDILTKGTELFVAGEKAAIEQAFGRAPDGGILSLPGVISRKKQVAPKLLAAAAR